jgi:Pre-toxin TG
MSISQQAMQYGQRRVTRKLVRAIPFLGAAIAAATLLRAIRRKGMFGGTVDTALDFVPFVGGAKNAAEIVRGRDFIADKRGVATR